MSNFRMLTRTFKRIFEPNTLILEYRHEKFRPREAEALEILRKVASRVEPIMRRRKWKVSILTEFYPAKKNLMGLNWDHGHKICLRLRHPYNERKFLPIEYIVKMMLHELCHIIHNHHNEAFDTLLKQLIYERKQLVNEYKQLIYEYEQLMIWNQRRDAERLASKSISGGNLPAAEQRTSDDELQRRDHALT